MTSNPKNDFKKVRLNAKDVIIPTHWDIVTLSSVASKTKGNKPKIVYESDEGKLVPYLTTETLRGDEQFWANPKSGVMTKGDEILITWDGTAGEIFPPKEGVLGSTMAALNFDDSVVDTKFAFYFLRYSQERIKSLTEGTGVPHVPKDFMDFFEIPVPPISEQIEIVEILSLVDDAGDLTSKIQEYYGEVKQGFVQDVILGNVFGEGGETVEKRLGPKRIRVPKNWTVKSIGDICDVKGGKRLPKGHNYANEKTTYPYIRVLDFDKGGIDDSNIKYLTKSTYQEISKYTIHSDDVYLSIAGYSLGIAGTVPDHLSGSNLTENACKLTGFEGAINEYVAMYLRSHFGQAEIERYRTITGQPKLALYRIKNMKIILPPLEVQKEAVNIREKIRDMIKMEEFTQDNYQQLLNGLMEDLLTAQKQVKT